MKISSQWQLKLLTGLLFTCMMAITAGSVQAGKPERIQALQPAVVVANSHKQANSDEQEHQYINRKGAVQFAADAFLPKSKETGRRMAASASFRGRGLALSFFPDRVFDIEINAESRPKPNILSMNGRGRGKNISSFSITVTPEQYIINYQDLETATLYRVVGDTATGRGQVTEIDLKKVPPAYDAPPLIPPTD
ncbi:MAG: hypothetical protein QNJ17_08740 [Desulfocapsaceae bacterium]|nr:hypothetical protein [Desulfocapsaceae bacterium]